MPELSLDDIRNRPMSHSAIDAIMECSHRYMQVNVLKNYTDTKSPQMEEGDKTHAAIAKYLQYDDPLPLGVQQYKPTVDIIKALPYNERYVEIKTGLSANDRPTGFFDKRVNTRVVIDYAVIAPGRELAVIVDWKTGKAPTEPVSFRQLYMAAKILSLYEPSIKQFVLSFVYLSDPTPIRPEWREVVLNNQIDELWLDIKAQANEARSRLFTPTKTPSYRCRWCPVKSCEHNRSK